MVEYMTAIAKEAVDMKKSSPQYEQLINSLFDIYLGKYLRSLLIKERNILRKVLLKVWAFVRMIM